MPTGTSVWPTNLVQQAWAYDTIKEAEMLMSMGKFMGTGVNSIIQKRTELNKDKGDRITFDILIDISQAPITGNSELKGQEAKLQFYTCDAIIDQTRQGVVKRGELEDLKSKKNLLQLAKQSLSKYFRNLMNEYIVKVMCGDTSFTYSNNGSAPTSGRIIYGGDATSDGSVGSNDWLGVYEISRLKTLAKLVTPRFRGVPIDGKEHFALFLHPYQTFLLKQDSSFKQAQREAMPRGSDNPLFKSALGFWDDVALYEDEYFISPTGNVRRGVLCGAQALMMPWGKGPTPDEDHDDYNERHGVSLKVIWGIKKVVFNSKDYATYAIDTYAPTPAGKSH